MSNGRKTQNRNFCSLFFYKRFKESKVFFSSEQEGKIRQQSNLKKKNRTYFCIKQLKLCQLPVILFSKINNADLYLMNNYILTDSSINIQLAFNLFNIILFVYLFIGLFYTTRGFRRNVLSQQLQLNIQSKEKFSHLLLKYLSIYNGPVSFYFYF